MKKRNIDPSIKLLINANVIESARVSDSAERSKLSNAFVDIRERSDADKLFYEIFNTAQTNEAKIYSLLGLFEVDKSTYNLLIKKLSLNDMVCVQEGSLLFDYPIMKIIEQIEDGTLLQMVLFF